MNDLLIDAITEKIAKKFTKYPIYVDDIGEDFERPSFYVYRISETDTILNRWTYTTNILIQIVYFSPLDEYDNILNTADQTTVINAVKNLFLGDLGVKFGKSWARLSKSNVDYTGDKDIFLQLSLDVTSSTRQAYDESQNIPTLNEFKFKGGIK